MFQSSSDHSQGVLHQTNTSDADELSNR